jgi:putative FmdB family regulatory protein
MPTYDYLCTDCGHTFEEFQQMSDPLLTECPDCNGTLKRLIGAGAGLIFKGSGFYITDYKKGNGQDKSKESKPKETPKEKPKAKASVESK